MRFLVLLLAASLLSAPALAQRERGHGFKPRPQHMSQEDRRRLREDVDSARGSYRHERRDEHRARRMDPDEREKLRRDVQEANRDMRRR